MFEKSLLCEKNCEKHFQKSIEKFYQGYMTTSQQGTKVISRLGNVKLRGGKKICFG